MQNQQEKLELLLEAIKELLIEVKQEQVIEKEKAEKRHKAYMQNLSKLREFNQIADMTNQVFETRISNIEKSLQSLIKTKSGTK